MNINKSIKTLSCTSIMLISIGLFIHSMNQTHIDSFRFEINPKSDFYYHIKIDTRLFDSTYNIKFALYIMNEPKQNYSIGFLDNKNHQEYIDLDKTLEDFPSLFDFSEFFIK